MGAESLSKPLELSGSSGPKEKNTMDDRLLTLQVIFNCPEAGITQTMAVITGKGVPELQRNTIDALRQIADESEEDLLV